MTPTPAAADSSKARGPAGRRPKPSRRWLTALVGLAALGGGAWWAQSRSRSPEVPVFGFEVVKVYDHDPKAFTQGLEFVDGVLFEGTGQYGQSQLRRVDLETGRVLKAVDLPEGVFGEGITAWGDRIIQLTWTSRTGFVRDKETLDLRGRFRYSGEGWGLTHDDRHLIMSDGTDALRFLDPESFEVVRTLRVTHRGRPVTQLNELEYIDGEILANRWRFDHIARISSRTGEVIGWIDLRGLRPRRTEPVPGSNAVLNGIAFDAANRRLFVTGKNWSDLFQIRLVRRP